MYTHRILENIIYQSFDAHSVSCVLGPRRIGKSTLVEHYIENHPEHSWVIMNMDNLVERQRIERGELLLLIEESIQSKLPYKEKVWVAIDEAQKCPPLFDQIKSLYDRFKKQNALKFILTGSGFLELHKLNAESLSGRIEQFHLHEFNIRESTVLLNPKITLSPHNIFDFIIPELQIKSLQSFIENLLPVKPILLKVIDELIIWGGLPEVLILKEQNKRLQYLANYLQTYLEKDVRAIETITDLNLYHRLITIISEQTGSLRDDKKIIEALQCSRDTMKKYRGFLHATLVYKEIYPYIDSSLKRLVKSPKGYLLNNGLISYITGLSDLKLLISSGKIGHRLENLILNELQVWISREYSYGEIYYWRTAAGAEVDFVIKYRSKIYPFEITYSSQINPKKLNNLRQFMSDEKNSEYGFYIYYGDFKIDHDRRIVFLPVWALI